MSIELVRRSVQGEPGLTTPTDAGERHQTVVAHGLTGIPKEQFAEVAREAEGKCPVSNAYRGSMTIELDAKAV